MTDPVPVVEAKVQSFWAKQVAWIAANPVKVAAGVVVLAVILVLKFF
jgi:hypothetical protein